VAGPLKLAYSQFLELESFARFGTRLDEATARAIEHGRRIRECLKQPESKPLSLLEQIVVLLTLATGLFDPVPLARMPDAEAAVRQASTGLSPDLAARLITDKLSNGDRGAVLAVATAALVPFQPAPAVASATASPPP
jgi:F-type H+-transporting ATPase subunit alpha